MSVLISVPWHPSRLPGLRLFLHAPYEAARRNLITGRTLEDLCERADGSLGSADTGQAYTQHVGSWGITSLQIALQSSTGTAPYVMSANVGILDYDYRFDVGEFTVLNTGRSAGGTFRQIDATNYLRIRFDTDGVSVTTMYLDKVVAGVVTNLTSAPITIASNGTKRWRANAVGNAITIYRDATSVLTYTLVGAEITLFNGATATRVGLTRVGTTSVTTTKWDNLRVDPIGSTATLATLSDDSGNAFDAAQATDAKKVMLVYGATGWVFRADGVDDLMTGSASISSALLGSFVQAIARRNSVSGVCTCFGSCSGADATHFLDLGANASNNRLSQRNADTADTITGSTAVAVDAPTIVGYHSSGTAYTIDVNGTAETLTVSAGANNGDWFGDTTTRSNYSIFGLAKNTESQFCAGDYCTFVLTDIPLSAADKTNLYHWLKDNNGLSSLVLA